MKKRNLYSISVLFLSIGSLLLFISCKTNKSSTSSLIEKLDENNCTYIYPKYKNEVRNITSHYCFTTCKTCPSDDDIKEFNENEEGREKLYKQLSNELCPLTENNTFYVDQTLSYYDSLIGNNSKLQLKQLDSNDTSLESQIKASDGTILNISSKNIIKDDVTNICSRDFISSGLIVVNNQENKDDSFMDEYGIVLYNKSWFSPEYDSNKYRYDHEFAQKKDDDTFSAWSMFLVATRSFNTMVEDINPERRLPRKEECTPKLIEALKYMKDKKESYSLSSLFIPPITNEFKFILQDSFNVSSHYLCDFEGKLHITKNDVEYGYRLITIKDLSSKDYTFISLRTLMSKYK